MSSSLVKSPLDICLKEICLLCDHWTLCLVVATTFASLAIRNNIFILGIYMGDLLYCAYSRLLPKPSSFLSSSLSESSLTFLFFIVYFLLQSFVMCPSLSYLKYFLISRSFLFPQQSFAMCPYLLQLKHFGFSSLKLLFDLPISIGCPLPPYMVPMLVL